MGRPKGSKNKKQKTDDEPEPAFRVHRMGFGLTYSAPDVEGEDNPITTHEELLEFLTEKYGENDYIIGKELHVNGKVHWHVYIKYYEKVDSTDPRLFDFKGVHPNIISGVPGKGWMAYCVKEKEFITNFL